MRLPSVWVRGIICSLSMLAELPWDSALRGRGLPWNLARCGVYILTLAMSPTRAGASNRLWFYWYLLATTSRGVALFAAQCELTGPPSVWLLLAAASTLVSVDPPFGSFRDTFNRFLSIIYLSGGLTGLRPSAYPHLRWMLVLLAAMEVLYFTGGWAWDTWWVFPIGQTLVKLVAWRLHARAKS